MLKTIEKLLDTVNGILFSEYTVFALLGTGVLFTVWSGFGQYRALTHGVQVIRGKYDRKEDPGAISHFEALSAALSATVGLGNIGGVAVAVALGGPGAIFWMWVIGVVGMALKMTEVTQSMLYRNTDDPDDPHGGPMFVVRDGLAKRGYATLGKVVGSIFVVTLLISALTGGNMFQVWNVADVTFTYFSVPPLATGLILAVLVALVIIGGIKRIGAFAGKIVPFMCGSYLLAGLYVVGSHVGEVPAMVALIVKSGLPPWLGGDAPDPERAFVGASFGFAAMWGIKRALFSSEAGQGSAPIAHAAAKSDEPVREGVVAGLEPFIDTLVVCSITAFVILATGAWNRPAEAFYGNDVAAKVTATADADGGAKKWSVELPPLPDKTPEAKRVLRIAEGSGWKTGETVFVVVKADENADTLSNVRTVAGVVKGDAASGFRVALDPVVSKVEPEVTRDAQGGIGVYGLYAGASLTAHAFDRAVPGLGMWLVVFASWLFALSTMISWSYYGEQGVVYLGGRRLVLPYKILYCALIAVTTLGFIKTDAQLDAWTTLGLGVMLVANIPIMLIFGKEAMSAYHEYLRKLKNGDFDRRPRDP